MAKRYVYKNVNKRSVNIGGYRFEEGQELESDVLINGFNEAVINGFLEFIERSPEGVKPEVEQVPQMGSAGKVKVIFHTGVYSEGVEVLVVEAEIDPWAPVKFPDPFSKEGEVFEGWFKDADLTKPVNVSKVRAPKEGELHLYGRYVASKDDSKHSEDSNPNGGTNPNGEAPSTTGSENK